MTTSSPIQARGEPKSKERPILFSAPMVRALLAGSKTQTRRPYKVRKHPDAGCEIAASELVREPQHVVDRTCPYGLPGDRLWVRETLACTSCHGTWYDADEGEICKVIDDDRAYALSERYGSDYFFNEVRKIPSIHMPRWASRILLEVVSVRVERLTDCSVTDAMAEGVKPDDLRQFAVFGANSIQRAAIRRIAALAPYQRLWESINGTGSWAANPWVWVVEFKRVAP
jgi:hypothetical protein